LEKMSRWAAVILAAGKGNRMKSRLPKVLHPIAGKEMVRHALDGARAAGVEQVVLVVGHEASQVQACLGEAVDYAVQPEQLGTGHALLQARPLLEGRADHVLVLNGDVPLISPETLRRMTARHLEDRATLTLLTCSPDDPSGLGRILRDPDGRVRRIAEEAEAGPEEKALREVTEEPTVLPLPGSGKTSLAFLEAKAGSTT